MAIMRLGCTVERIWGAASWQSLCTCGGGWLAGVEGQRARGEGRSGGIYIIVRGVDFLDHLGGCWRGSRDGVLALVSWRGCAGSMAGYSRAKVRVRGEASGGVSCREVSICSKQWAKRLGENCDACRGAAGSIGRRKVRVEPRCGLWGGSIVGRQLDLVRRGPDKMRQV